MSKTLTGTAIAASWLALAASAAAAPRFAAPSGAGDCSSGSPCSFATAVSGATSGDEVIVAPGTYDVTATVEATVPLAIHGVPGEPRPRLVGAAGVVPIKSSQTIDLADLTVESTDSDEGSVFAVGTGSTFTRLEVLAARPAGGAAALRPGTSFTLRDSLLIATGADSSSGLYLQGTTTGTATIRNVTAIANGPYSTGITVVVVYPGATVTVDVVNVIADAETDLSAGGPTGTAVFTVSHSSFDTASGITEGPGNQTTPPAFVDAAGGDYREAPGSPTIDAGSNDAQNGATDLDGHPRVIGAAPDIGAFEFDPAATTTTTSSTTTTTLPCAAEATVASVGCRIAGLAADVSVQVPAGALRDKLVSLLGTAATATQAAGAATTKRALRKGVRRTAHALDGCRKRLRSRAAKALDATLRQGLIDRTEAIKQHVKLLGKDQT